MNKRALIGLIVLPVVLVGVMFWTRKTTHEQLESVFCRDVLSDTQSFQMPGKDVTFPVCVWRLEGGYPDVLGRWNQAQMKQFLSDVHLRPVSQKSGVKVPGPFYALFYGSNSFSNYYGISLDGSGSK